MDARSVWLKTFVRTVALLHALIDTSVAVAFAAPGTKFWYARS